MTTHTIYCFCNGGLPTLLHACALADDGHVLANHGCSDLGFCKHDLGIGSNWKHDSYDAHFGAGNWTLEWVEDPENHAGFQAAIKLNSELEVTP